MLEIAHTGSLTDTAFTHRARDGEGGRMCRKTVWDMDRNIKWSP